MKQSPESPPVRDVTSLENEVVSFILRKMGLVNEDVLTEAIQESLRDSKRSLLAILEDSEKISPQTREKLERMTQDVIRSDHANESHDSKSRKTAADSIQKERHDAESGETPGGGYATRPSSIDSRYMTDVGPLKRSRVERNEGPATDALIGGAGNSFRMRYQKVELYRHGGLAQVWIGKDLELGRRVAVKEILPTRADDQDARDLFEEEALKTASLEHPSVIPIYGKGRQADGRPYYAMRFVTGTTYLEEIERWHHSDPSGDVKDRALNFRKLLSRLLDVCDAVHYAHCNNILHLDLKPQNVMLGDFGETFVLDWGLSRTYDSTVSIRFQTNSSLGSGKANSGTSLGSIPGTPQYMSPEQAQGRSDRLGPHTDVYSLGAMLYHLLVAKPPRFDAKTADEAWQQARSGIFQNPQAVRKDVNLDLNAICLKAMSYDAADRYNTADAFRRDLECWLANEQVTARTLKPWHPEQILRVIQRRRYIALTAAVALPIIAVVAGLLHLNNRIQQENAKYISRFAEIFDKATSNDTAITTVLEVLLNQYKEVSTSQANDTVGKNLEKIAKLCGKIATTDEAIDYQKEAIQRYELFQKNNPNQQISNENLLNAKEVLSQLLLDKGDFEQATDTLKELIKSLEQLSRSEDVRLIKARVFHNLALAHKGQNDFKESEKDLKQSGQLLQGLLRERDITPVQIRDYQSRLGDNEGLYGDLELVLGNFPGAEWAYKESLRYRKNVLEFDPHNDDSAIKLAWAADNFLRLARRNNDNAELREEFANWDKTAHNPRKKLYLEKPNNRNFRREFAWSCLFKGEVLLQLLQSTDQEGEVAQPQMTEQGLHSNASTIDPRKQVRKELARCYDLSRQLTDDDNSNADSRSHRAFSAIKLAFLDYREKNFEDARENLADAEKYLHNLAIDDNAAVLYKSALRLALLAELEKNTYSKRANSYREQAYQELKKAVEQDAKFGSRRPRQWELNTLKELPGMESLVTGLEKSSGQVTN